MAAPNPAAESSLRVARTFGAPRERVFRAWTDPEALKKWFAPSDAFSTSVLHLEVRAGGRYRVEMKAPDGKVHCAVGTYREVKPPERLVFTWSWESEPGFPETLVTVKFHDLGQSTEVVLTHELLPSAQARDQHEQGWKGILERLAKAL